ncbi:MAG: hypothetical protein ACFE8J_18910 [Candidatus Heimdallarchaeota archaeon]
MKFLLEDDKDLLYYRGKCARFHYCELVCSLSFVWLSPDIHLSQKSDLSNYNPQCVIEYPVKLISFMFRTDTNKTMVNLRSLPKISFMWNV